MDFNQMSDEEKAVWDMAKAAYEAYCDTTKWKSAITGAALPPFVDTPEAVQVGWMAAAQAVKRFIENGYE
jgi:hypothetical protein